MPDREQPQVTSPETGDNHEELFIAKLIEAGHRIDEILSRDAEGGRRERAEGYDSYGREVAKGHTIGDRYLEEVSRVARPGSTAYAAAYNTTLEGPQPDVSEHGQVEYSWEVTSTDDEVLNFVRDDHAPLGKGFVRSNILLLEGDPLEAAQDVSQIITDGLQKGTLIVRKREVLPTPESNLTAAREGDHLRHSHSSSRVRNALVRTVRGLVSGRK